MMKILNIILISVSLLILLVFVFVGSYFIYKRYDPNVKQSINPNSTAVFSVARTIGDFIVSSNYSMISDCGFIDDDNRIFGGSVTKLFEFPWMARLAYNIRREIKYMCGGSLITPNYVLTAAHCVVGPRASGLTFVRLGEYNTTADIDCELQAGVDTMTCSPPTQDIRIAQIVPHPDFNLAAFANDIALIKLSTPANITVENVKTICLPLTRQIREMPLRSVTITGWGLKENGVVSEVLRQASLPIIPSENCSRIYSNIQLTSDHICIGGTKSLSCEGDSGGPLQTFAASADSTIVRYYQYGLITSGPTSCFANGLPNVNTRIHKYLEWILNNIN